MKKRLFLLSLCVLFSLSGTLSNDNIGQRNRELILRNKLQPADKNFFGILLVPYIICFFAAHGIWPQFPQYMQSSVNEMGEQIFAQSDDHIRNFCKGKFLFHSQAYRPVFLKGLFFPFSKGDTFRPIDDWTPKLTTMTPTIPPPAETKLTMTTSPDVITTVTTEKTTTTTEATTTTTEATTKADTTTPDVSVITFDPNKPITPICNCSQPKLIKTVVNTTSNNTVESEEIASTTPASTAVTEAAHIKIEVKNVISFIDLILSYLNMTRSNP